MEAKSCLHNARRCIDTAQQCDYARRRASRPSLPMGYVLDENPGEDACGRTVTEAHGIAHHIEFSVDHISQEPKMCS